MGRRPDDLELHVLLQFQFFNLSLRHSLRADFEMGLHSHSLSRIFDIETSKPLLVIMTLLGRWPHV
ncbi:hypothetical protein CQ13_39105 [Bradyrhizobium retamae]|uniref:Uncharacterized protein n=1 Tax=Bradyrhizobium retamae TaxID=1300035 RepID=A0A0R3NA59_9BRAD|nr:hypothetical protein CQ13_39105 [Bradyrhizobium retamae]